MKLQRLIRYMKFKDMKSAVSRTASVDEDEPPEHGRIHNYTHNLFYFIVSGEINVYLVKIKLVSVTSEMKSYHFTIVTDTIYVFTPCFGRLRFSSLFQMWILPPLQIF